MPWIVILDKKGVVSVTNFHIRREQASKFL
jgi:hypothetical protein